MTHWSAGGGDTQTPCQCLGPDVASVAAVTNDTNSPAHNVSTDMWPVSGGFWVVCDCFNYSIMSRRQRFIDWWLLPNLIGSQCRTHSEDPRRSERVLELQHYNLQLSRLETLNARWISDWDENWCLCNSCCNCVRLESVKVDRNPTILQTRSKLQKNSIGSNKAQWVSSVMKEAKGAQMNALLI